MTFDPSQHASNGSRANGRGGLLAGLLLILLAATVLLPGLDTIPVIDRDEARFVQASRQMLDSGTLEGWTIPMVGEKYRLNKPPLIYWLQAGWTATATSLGGGSASIWMFRFPSVLAAMCTVLLTWLVGRSMFGGRTGLLAGAMMAVSPLVAFDAHMARSDEVLVALTTGAMAVLWWCWKDGRGLDRETRLPWSRTTLLWLLVGLGMLAKGPITPMVVLLTALVLAAWTREWRWLLRLRPFTGLPIALIVFAPWVLLAGLSVGFERLATIAWDEVIVRSASGRESHGAPPGYHLVLMVALLWPGTLLTGIAFGRSWRRARSLGQPATTFMGRAWAVLAHPCRGRAAEAYCLAWLVPGWLVFELAATKLPHYPLPLYPAIALISARAVLAGTRSLPQALTGGARAGFVLWYVIGLGIVLLPVILLVLAGQGGDLAVPPPGSPRMLGTPWWLLGLLGIGTLFGGVLLTIGLTRALRGRLLEAQLLAMPAAALALGLSFGVALPAAWPVWITPRLTHHLEQGGALDGTTPIAAIGYREDSLVHATNGRLEPIGAEQLTAWLEEHPDGWVVVPTQVLPEDLPGRVRGEVSGFNYSNGNWFDLAVVEAAAGES
jgi:4-amino-4-deoxy-L-arabinose transferase-like glycosyltransferase